MLLRQALSNLARNAVEACAAAGIVPDVRIEAIADRAARTLRVLVTDNGPGIEPALRERVFRPFFTTKRDGTGLGLALVQKIVVTHNGRVQAGGRAGGAGTAMQVTPAASRSVTKGINREAPARSRPASPHHRSSR